jgi:cytochrome c oxidase cbb3-type subunit 1
MQGLMWRSYNDMGFLQYSFIEGVIATHPMYLVRAIGGIFFLTGGIIMAYNFYKTINSKELSLDNV